MLAQLPRPSSCLVRRELSLPPPCARELTQILLSSLSLYSPFVLSSPLSTSLCFRTRTYKKINKKNTHTGAQIILSKLPIGDLATQYFADRGLFCAGRVEGADMNRVAKATGGKLQSSVNDLTPDVLGEAGHFDETQVMTEKSVAVENVAPSIGYMVVYVCALENTGLTAALIMSTD